MLKDLCKVYAPSGCETKMQEYIKDSIIGLFDEVKTDALGNVAAIKGTPQGFALECGIDTLGIMITSKDKGKAYFAGVGGINAEYLLGKKIVFEDGSFGIVRCDGKITAETKLSELYLETESDNLKIGDFGVLADEYSENSKKYFAHGIGDRIGLAAVLKAVKTANLPKNLCVLFSVQRRIGGKGLKAFLGKNTFDKVLTVDGISDAGGIKSGEGCAIVAVDSRGVSDPQLRAELERTAKENKIKYQSAVTDENLLLEHIATTGRGAACGALGIPVAHKGKAFESVMKSDFESAVNLIKSVIEKM